MYRKRIFSGVGEWIMFAQDIVHWWAAVIELRVTWNAEKFLRTDGLIFSHEKLLLS